MKSGCWTEGVKALYQGTTFSRAIKPLSMEAWPSPLSSRAQPRDLQFSGPFVEMFFDRAHADFLPRSAGHGRVCAFP